MPLTALPVSVTDLTILQQGVQFFTNNNEAAAQVAAINLPGTTTASVFIYTAQLLQNNIGLSQVAMAVSAIAEGGTILVGNTTTPNTLTFLSTQFLPAQFAIGVTLQAQTGIPAPVYASEALGLALASTTGFQNTFGGLSTTAFVQAVATASGVNPTAIQGFVQNWINFYSGVGSGAHPGLTVQQAAFGAALGDSVGVALLNPTAANLQTVTSTTPGANPFSPNTVAGSVANALIDNAEGKYTTGVALGALPAHQPLQGEAISGGTVINLTTGVDPVVLSQSNSTVNGTIGGAGQTWTPGDTITAAAGTTGQVFNLTGIAAAGSVIDVTSVGPGNTVSGVQTANVSAAGQAVQGDFTATGPEGAWTGLTQLSVASGGSVAGADLLTVAATTTVQLTDTLVSTTTNPLTVNGSLTTTITENNGTFVNGGITVNGGSGTTTVSITQTEAANGNDGIVKIIDANGASTTAAGTITKITLDGLSHFADFTTGPNMIIDNALTNLTVNHSDLLGPMVGLAIIDNLTTPTATALTLSLGADGVNAAGAAVSQLVIADVNAEYSTIHLTLGAQNSFVNIIDNGLTTLDTPSAGTGALVGVPGGPSSIINSAVAAAVNFDFSGLNGPNDIAVNRLATNNADVYTLGNFGTNVGVSTTEQQLEIQNTNPANTATINFGSGAYIINDELHPAGTHSYVQTAANGAGLANLSTASQWAVIMNLHGAPNSDTLKFATDNVQTFVNSGAAPSIAMGIANALTTAPHTASEFEVGGNTFIFDHADNSASLTAADAMVQLVGIHPIAAVSAANAITFTV